MIRRTLLAALAVTATVVPRPALASWESPEFAAALGRPRRIAILPAQSEMVRTRVNEALPFVKETRELEAALRLETAAQLTALGYEADLTSLSPERLASDRDVQALVRQLESQVAGVVDVAAGRPRDIGRGRFSVGEAVIPLQAATGADGFLWLQSQSIVPSKGQRALGSVFSVLAGTYAVPSNRTQLVAWLIDARTGDLASVAIAEGGGAVLKEPAKVAANVARALFRQWPAHGVARRVSSKRLAAEERATKPEVPLEGRNVEELETIARFEDAVARLEGGTVAGAPEEIGSREDFTADGHAVEAASAPPAESQPLFRSPGAPPDPAREPAPAAAATPVSASTPSPRAAWDAAAAPSHQIVMQMTPGELGITLRNGAGEPALVSIDLAAWAEIAPSEERRFDAGPGSHRILAIARDGRELARSNVLLSSSHARAEIVP